MIVIDGQTTDIRAIAYSEREREFTFAKKQVYGSFHLCMDKRVGDR